MFGRQLLFLVVLGDLHEQEDVVGGGNPVLAAPVLPGGVHQHGGNDHPAIEFEQDDADELENYENGIEDAGENNEFPPWGSAAGRTTGLSILHSRYGGLCRIPGPLSATGGATFFVSLVHTDVN